MNLHLPKQLLLGLILCLMVQPVMVQRLLGQEGDSVTFKIDNAHTSLVFAISHFGLSYTYGRFNQISGSFELSNNRPTEKGFQFTLDADSIDTNNADRDNHLKGADFFDVDQFPEIKFVTNEITEVDGEYRVDGDLTIRGKTQPVMLPMTLVGVGKGPFGKERAGFFTKFTIKRSDFGMDTMQGQIGDKVSITFSFEGIRE